MELRKSPEGRQQQNASVIGASPGGRRKEKDMDQNQEKAQQMEELWEQSAQPAENEKKKGLFWWQKLLFVLGGIAVISALVIIFVQIKKESYRFLEHPMAMLCVKQIPKEFAKDEVWVLSDSIYYTNYYGNVAFGIVTIGDADMMHSLTYGCTYVDSASDWLEEQAASMHVNENDNVSVSRGIYTNNVGREFQYICVSLAYDLDGETGTSDFLGFATELGDGEVITVTMWNSGGQSYVPEDYFKYLNTKALEIEPR